MSSVVYLFLPAVLTSGISAHEEPKAVALYERQITPGPSQSVATPTAASSSSTTTSAEILEAVNITLDGQIFPPSRHTEGVTTTPTTDFTINCDNCAITGNFSISAGDSSIPSNVFKTPSDVEQRANGSDFNFEDIWAAATIDYLNATFEFGVNLKASNTTNEFSVPLDPLTKSKTIGIFNLTATLNTEIHGWVNTSNDVNFTYGFEFGVPAYSEVIIDLSDSKDSTSFGFNETRLAPIPFKSTRSDIDIDIELSFRPSITFVISVDLAGAGGNLSLDVGLDVPKLDVGIRQVHNVSSSCDPAPASLPPDQIYQNLTLVSPSLGFGLFEILEEGFTLYGIKASAEQPFYQNFTHDLPTTCLFYDAAKQTLAPAPVVKPAHLSNASGVYAPLAAALTAIAIVALTAII